MEHVADGGYSDDPHPNITFNDDKECEEESFDENNLCGIPLEDEPRISISSSSGYEEEEDEEDDDIDGYDSDLTKSNKILFGSKEIQRTDSDLELNDDLRFRNVTILRQSQNISTPSITLSDINDDDDEDDLRTTNLRKINIKIDNNEEKLDGYEESEEIVEDNNQEEENKNKLDPIKLKKKDRPLSIVKLLPVQKKPQKGAVSIAWNEEFQKALDMEEGPQKWEKLARTARDFVYCSKTYGKIIISEYSLPDDEKTIIPLKEEGNGLAGGRKYITAGIFFKFALDLPIYDKETDDLKFYMYGTSNRANDEGAMKAARNDMIGLLSYYNSGVKGLHFPLMSQIDYRGYRLIALSIIPIDGDKTLEYGSRDQGKTLKCKAGIAKIMEEVGNRLNLKGHKIQNHLNKIIYGPADIEAHKGTDGKYYAVDFARVFPPEGPSRRSREIFYKLLRPEFVRSYSNPLSSDACSRFSSEDESILCRKEVISATEYLYRTLIPQFIRQQLIKIKDQPENYYSYRLTEQLHRCGLNCRHLGVVRSKCDPNIENGVKNLRNCDFLRKYLLSEMLARLLTCILRNLLREETKNSKIAREDPYFELVYQFLTIVLKLPIPDPPNGPSKLDKPIQIEKDVEKEIPFPNEMNFLFNDEYWCIEMKILIQQKFKRALSDFELYEHSDIRNKVFLPFVITRLLQQTGIKLNKHAFKEYKDSPSNFVLMKFDIQKVSARVRHLNVIDEALANLLFDETKTRSHVRPGLWNAINDKFQRAVASNTTNPQTFLRWGNMLLSQFSMIPFQAPFKNSIFSDECLKLLKSAYEKFSDAETLQNLWEIPFNKGQIQCFRGVVLLLFATTDAIALRQWYFRDASTEFQQAFKKKPHCFQLIINKAQMLYEESKKIIIGYNELKQKQKEFLLLKSYYLFHTCLQVAPILPDCKIFYKAGYILYNYIREVTGADINSSFFKASNNRNIRLSQSNNSIMNDMNLNIGGGGLSSPNIHHDNSSSGVGISNHSSLNSNNNDSDDPNFYNTVYDINPYLLSEAGSMFESAFLLSASASDENFTYTFPNGRYTPKNPYQANHPLLIEVLKKENELYDKLIDIDVMSSFSQLYFIPFSMRNPTNDYTLSQSFNRLFNLLTQSTYDPYDKYFDISQSSFVIFHPCFHPVKISQCKIRLQTSFELKIHLIGSNYPNNNITLETLQIIKSKPKQQYSSYPSINRNILKESMNLHQDNSNQDENLSSSSSNSEFDEAFLIGSFSILPSDSNSVLNFPVPPVLPHCKYIHCLLDYDHNIHKNQKYFRFHCLSFYGYQILNQLEEFSLNPSSSPTSSFILSNNKPKSPLSTSTTSCSSKKQKSTTTKKQEQLKHDMIHFIPRNVSWVKEKHSNIKINQISNSKISFIGGGSIPFTGVVRTLINVQNNKPFSIRATPAFTIETDEIPTSKKSSGSSTKSSKKSSRIKRSKKSSSSSSSSSKKSPKVFYLSEKPSKADESLINSSIEAYKSIHRNRNVEIIKILSLDELKKKLIEIENSSVFKRLIHKGLIRIVCANDLNNSNIDNESKSLHIINLIKENLNWRNILILIYYPDGFNSSLCDEEHYIWTTTNSRHVLDFMSMKWSTPGMNFDPFGTFQRLRELHGIQALDNTNTTYLPILGTPTTIPSDLMRIARRMRSSSFSGSESDCETTNSPPPARQLVSQSSSAVRKPVSATFTSPPRFNKSFEESDIQQLSSHNDFEEDDSETKYVKPLHSARQFANSEPLHHDGDDNNDNMKKKNYYPFIYFEITIPNEWDCNSCEFAIGVTPAQFDIYSLPGYCLGSYAWHGSEGVLYCGQGKKSSLFEIDGGKHKFRSGDIIGCGYDIYSQQIYWTKNGIYIGSAASGDSSVNPKVASFLFPTIGLGSSSISIEIEGNFGCTPINHHKLTKKKSFKPFKFDYLNIHNKKELILSPNATKEEVSLRTSQNIRKLNPYDPEDLFTNSEKYERNDLIILSEISKFSFALQCLYRAHIKNRTIIQKEQKKYIKYRELTLNRCLNLKKNHLANIFHLFPSINNLSVNLSFAEKLPNHFLNNINSNKFSNITLLNLEGILGLDQLTATSIVQNCPNLEGIRVWNTINDESLAIFSSLSKLIKIEFHLCNLFTDSGISSLLKGKKSFQSIQFEKCSNITDFLFDILKKNLNLNSLLKIRFDSCFKLQNEEKLISFLKKCYNLISFSFAGNAMYIPPISDKTIDVLCSISGKKLKALNIYRCTLITQKSFEKLSTFCSHLEELNMGHLKNIPDSCLAIFAKSFHSLKRLELVSTNITDKTLEFFARNHVNLRQLSVQRCELLSSNCIQVIVPILNSLTFLSIKEITVSHDLIYLLAEPNILPALRRLDLRRTIHCSNSSDFYFSIVNLKAEKPNWIIYEKSNALIAAGDGKNISSLRFPPDKINSVRTRRNSL